MFKLSSQLHKQIIPIRVLIFFTVFASSGAEAVMSCQLSGGGISGPDPNVLGQADCSRIGGSFNTISIDDSELTGYFTYSIYCDYNGYSNSSRGGGCSVTDFFADKETIEKEAKNSADNPNQCSTDGPINTVTGNKHKTHVDIDSNSPAFFKPEFTRIYNSSAVSNRDFVIGKNWLHSYQRSLQLLDFVNSKLRDPGNVNHSPSNFSTPANACTGGFSSVDGAIPQWNNGRCELIKNGQYIGTMPIRANVDPSWATDDFASYTYARLLREDGNEIKFRQPEYDWPNIPEEWLPTSADTKYKFSYTRDLIGGSYVSTYYLTDENDNIETYNSTGKLISIQYSNGIIETLADVDINKDDTGAVINSLFGEVFKLGTVSNNLGKTITLEYYVNGMDDPNEAQIKSVTEDAVADEDDRAWLYYYDAGRLVKVINPDLTEKNYHYEDTNFLNVLTGLTDERNLRYSTFLYNVDGKAESSYLGEPTTPLLSRISNVIVNYSGTDFNTVTDSRLNTKKYYYSSDVIQNVMTQFDGPECVSDPLECANDSKQYQYDLIPGDSDASTLNLISKTEYGKQTVYGNYDVQGNPGLITEAVGTTEEIIKTYDYDVRYQSKISKVTEPSVRAGSEKETNIAYDDFANVTSVITNGFDITGAPVSRTQIFTYGGPFNQLTEINGPRPDVDVIDKTVITYYLDDVSEGFNRARMKSMTAPLGIVLFGNINYTSTGEMSSYTSANNLQVDFTYYAGNDRLETIKQTDTTTGTSRTTRLTYLETGELTSITTGDGTPEATTVTFEYDSARRLTRVYDGLGTGLGNYIEYTLDTEGNITNESIYDFNNDLQKALNESFDAYNRSDVSTQLNETSNLTFAPDGTLDLSLDGKGSTTDYTYDALLRLKTITQDQGGANPQTGNAVTQLDYDVQDNLTNVIDPNNGLTDYVYDDLGNLTTQYSADTGNTLYTFDEAGNIKTKTDAKGQLFQYSYDALNRLTSIAGPDAIDDITMTYDSCVNGQGRLCSVVTAAATTMYSYTAFGEVSQHQAIAYAYDSAGRVTDITYPSGAVTHYDYDAAGQVNNVSLSRNGSTVTVASSILYTPFGDKRQMLYGNALTLDQGVDLAYRMASQNISGVMSRSYNQYDDNGNLTAVNDSLAINNFIYTYDELNRLDTYNDNVKNKDYDYDKNGNRTQLNDNSGVKSYVYEPNTNRMDINGSDNVELDDNGNTITDGQRSFIYTTHNRLYEVLDSSVSLVTYQYNGLNQRIKKTLTDNSGRRFIYGTEGQLLAETDINGNVLNEYIYLNGQLLAKYEADSDSDGQTNAQEDVLGTNPTSVDTDGDGLSDNDEMFVYGTSHLLADTDGDGIDDKLEIILGSNPLDNASTIGDINSNGSVNVGDYVLLVQFVMGIRTPTSAEQMQADLNSDGFVNVKDLLLMQKALLGLGIASLDELLSDLPTMYATFIDMLVPKAYAALGDGAIYFVHNDHLGTPKVMTDEAGVEVWSAEFDPFGKAVVSGGVEMNVRFAGQYYDSETDLHYNYFRYYDPATGRYLTSDPIGLVGGLNTFGYVGGNPLSYIDPTGESSILNVVIAAVAVAIIIDAYVSAVDVIKEQTDASKAAEEATKIGQVNPDVIAQIREKEKSTAKRVGAAAEKLTDANGVAGDKVNRFFTVGKRAYQAIEGCFND